MLEGVNAGRVPITPVNPKAVPPDQLERRRPDIERHARDIEQRTAAHLLDTHGTGTGEAEGSSREESDVALLVPLDEQSVVPAIDGVRNGVHEGYWLLAIGYWLLAIGYWLLAIGGK